MDDPVRHLPVQHLASQQTVARRQASGSSVMLWTMLCWETLGAAIHVNVLLKKATKHCCTLSLKLLLDCCGIFQQDNSPCDKAKLVQKWHNDKFKVLI